MIAAGKVMQYLSRPLRDAEELIKELGIKVSDETLKSVEVSIRWIDDGADSDWGYENEWWCNHLIELVAIEQEAGLR